MITDYVPIALRNVRRRGIRSWLTMLGIFIGIAAVVSLISLGTALQNAITGQFSSLDPDKLIIANAETGFGPPGSTAVKKLNEHDKKIIEEVNGIDVVVSRLIRIVQVKYNGIVQFRYVANIPEDKEEVSLIYDSMNIELEQGRLLSENDRRKVILGNDFLDDSFEKKIKVGSRLTIQGEEFEVVGILKKAGTFTINSVIIMPDEDLRRILNIGDEFDILVAQLKNRDDASKVAKEVEEKLRDDRNVKEGEEDFSVQTPEQSLSSINTILSIINIVISGIAAISLLIGGVGITNTMYTSVLERKKEIGIMKSIGAKNEDILGIFLIESALLGLVGGLIGAFIGLGLAFTVSFVASSALPGLDFGVQISYPLLFMAIFFSLAIGSVSGILPALQAAKLKPVEALRG